MNSNQYQCSMCHGIFDKEWSDEEAKAEHDRDFSGESMETACVVCDDCYQKVRPDTHPKEMAQYLAAKKGETLMDLLPLNPVNDAWIKHMDAMRAAVIRACAIPPEMAAQLGLTFSCQKPTCTCARDGIHPRACMDEQKRRDGM